MAVGLFLLALLVRPALSQFRPDHNILANMPPADKTLFRFTFVVELRHSMTMSDGGQERLATFDESDSALKFIGRQTEGNSSDCTAKLVALGDGDERKIPIADGLSRKLLLVNGMLPGPTILVNKDATVEVMVINRVPSEAISIHWQGQSQNGTAWMDGSARVAQCQILPGQKFLYRFQADNSGTHWWRASLASQVAAGLYGPLIVVDRAEAETHEFEAEYVAVLQDLFLSSSESNFSHQPNRGRCDYIARSLDGTQMGRWRKWKCE